MHSHVHTCTRAFTRIHWDELPEPWGSSCRSHRSSYWAWSSDGTDEKHGWLELQASNVLRTSFGWGTWEAQDGSDGRRLRLTFGACIHLCELDGGGSHFVVVAKARRSDGRNAYSPGQAPCRGWFLNNDALIGVDIVPGQGGVLQAEHF